MTARRMRTWLLITRESAFSKMSPLFWDRPARLLAAVSVTMAQGAGLGFSIYTERSRSALAHAESKPGVSRGFRGLESGGVSGSRDGTTGMLDVSVSPAVSPESIVRYRHRQDDALPGFLWVSLAVSLHCLQ
jgi:hypothetical protein